MDFLSSAVVWAHQWQTLISGLLALLAAYFTIRAIRHQIAQTDRIEVERTARDFDAARATLPLGLAAISRYLRQSMEIGFEILEKNTSKSIAAMPRNYPQLPTESISFLERLISKANDAGLSSAAARIIADIQVLAARTEDNYVDVNDPLSITFVSRLNVISTLVDAAIVSARVNRFYSFARRQGDFDSSPVDWAEVRRAFGFRLMADDDHEVSEYIESREKSGHPPKIT